MYTFSGRIYLKLKFILVDTFRSSTFDFSNSFPKCKQKFPTENDKITI